MHPVKAFNIANIITLVFAVMSYGLDMYRTFHGLPTSVINSYENPWLLLPFVVLIAPLTFAMIVSHKEKLPLGFSARFLINSYGQLFAIVLAIKVSQLRNIIQLLKLKAHTHYEIIKLKLNNR